MRDAKQHETIRNATKQYETILSCPLISLIYRLGRETVFTEQLFVKNSCTHYSRNYTKRENTKQETRIVRSDLKCKHTKLGGDERFFYFYYFQPHVNCCRLKQKNRYIKNLCPISCLYIDYGGRYNLSKL